MELYQQIIFEYLSERAAQMPVAQAAKIVDQKSYQALRQIKEILTNPTLDDPACFQKIEEIVRVFEQYDPTGLTRHDFG